MTDTGGIAARQAAFAILNDILFRRKSMDEAYAQAAALQDMPARDRGFVRVLVTTVLKRLPQIDAALAQWLREPADTMKPQQLRNIFRLGLAQLAFLGTPAHAAVNTTVELAEAEGIAHQKPLVNAIMRRAAQAGVPALDDRDAGRINTPDWMWENWMRDYGVETALDIAAAHLSEAPVDFTLRDGEDTARWAETLGADVLPTGSLRLAHTGFVPGLPGFDDGAWWVQNAAAAVPVRMLGDVRGKTVIDLCAAPGGKTAQLAAAGARVIAVDRSAPRMARLVENMQRLGFAGAVETVVADSATWMPQEKADAVLLDAPCTATGTLRHQPDACYLKDIRDQDKLAALQARLLAHAAEMLKPDGLLVYCTCSLQKAEGENLVDSVLAQGVPLARLPVAAGEISGITDMLTEKGEWRALPSCWPDIGGIDGFYAARFRRV